MCEDHELAVPAATYDEVHPFDGGGGEASLLVDDPSSWWSVDAWFGDASSSSESLSTNLVDLLSVIPSWVPYAFMLFLLILLAMIVRDRPVRIEHMEYRRSRPQFKRKD